MKKKWICTMAKDIRCPERALDGLCQMEESNCSFRMENAPVSSQKQLDHVRKEKWFEKYYK